MFKIKYALHSLPYTNFGNFGNFKKGGALKNFWGEGKQKRGVFSKIKGGTQLFKLNLGIEKGKN